MKTLLAIVALGSNIGDSRKIILEAMGRLKTFSDAPILKSSLWRTSPVNCPPDSPEFVNAVAAFIPRKGESPESLLKKLQDLETEFGRTPKKVLNEPRPLDLDLIAFGAEARQTPELTLPHPRTHLRKFVLAPLNEIAPDFVLAGQGRAARALLDDLASEERVERME